MNKYQWKMKAFSKGIDENDAIAELERIESLYGALTPENILTESEKPESTLHRLFVWDNDIAAHNYRLQQARNIINNIEVVVISEGGTKTISAFEIISTQDGRVYKNVKDFSSDDITQVRDRTMREIAILKNKLSFYKGFEKTILKLSEAQDALKEV